MTLPLPLPPVTVTEQLPDVSVQDVEENVTVLVPGVPCAQFTVPVGLEPVTVAVHVLGEPTPPTATREGTQLTVVVVLPPPWNSSTLLLP